MEAGIRALSTDFLHYTLSIRVSLSGSPRQPRTLGAAGVAFGGPASISLEMLKRAGLMFSPGL